MTNVVLADELVIQAREATGIEEVDRAVSETLELHFRLQRQAAALRTLRGSFQWEGNLEESRRNRDFTFEQ